MQCFCNEKKTLQKMVTTSINIETTHFPSHGGDAENTLFYIHYFCTIVNVTFLLLQHL